MPPALTMIRSRPTGIALGERHDRNLSMLSFLTRLYRRHELSIDKVRRDVDRRSALHPEHHWSIDHYARFKGAVPGGMVVSFLGDVVRENFCGYKAPPTEIRVPAALPSIDEEYFEYTDILEACLSAGTTFTFLELGAGWGRWSARAALAARQLGKSIKLGLVEGAPQHIPMIHASMADNGVRPEDYKLYEVAIGAQDGETLFCVEKPNEGAIWFGQGAVAGVVSEDTRIGEHEGRPMYQHIPGGSCMIWVPQIPLSAVLADFEFIDLVDMDLQGAEREALAEAIEPLTLKVRRLHIGTHGADIEAAVRGTLSEAGWICLRDYPGGQGNDTNFGRCHFVDGIQTWVNPKLL